MARRHILKDVRDFGLDPKKAHKATKARLDRPTKEVQVTPETKPVAEAPAPVEPVAPAVEELPAEALEEVPVVEEVKEVKKTTRATSRKSTRSSTRSRTRSTTKKKEE